MKPVSLKLVRDTRAVKAGVEVRNAALLRVKECSAALKNRAEGYAMIFWDRDGWCSTVIRGGDRFPTRIVPTLAHDVLTQHVSCDMAETEIKNMLWPEK